MRNRIGSIVAQQFRRQHIAYVVVERSAERVQTAIEDGALGVEADASREDIPRLVAHLVREGQDVYGARVLTSTLEEVYVEAVGGQTS